MIFKAGTSNPPLNASYSLPVSEDFIGTSMNYLGSAVSYRYWQLFVGAANFDNNISINEVFIGKRLELSINPEYPFKKNLDISDIELSVPSGKKYVYNKYNRINWEFSYPGLDSDDFNNLEIMRGYCKGSYTPMWMCIDRDDNKFDTKFTRLKKNSWKKKEVSYQVYDVSFSVEEDL